MRPVNWSNPVARNHPLNHGLVAWWLVTPNTRGGPRWPDLAGRHDGTLNGIALNAAWDRPRRRRGAVGSVMLNQTGSDDFVDVGDISTMEGDGDYTFMLWVYVRNTSQDGDLIAKGAHAGNEPFVFWYDQAGPDKWNFLFTDSGANYSGVFASAADADAALNTWVHLALVIRGGVNTRLYINGVEDGNSPFDTSAVAGIANTADPYRLGNDNTPVKPFDGELDDVRMYNRALPHAGVRTYYNLSRKGYPGLFNYAHPRHVKVPVAAGNNLAWQLTGGRPALAGSGGLAG